MDFKSDKKGYNKEQVDEYIKKLVTAYDKSLSEQKERIFDLKSQVLKAEESIKAYKEKSSLVSKAIYNAVAKADEIERLSQIKYNQEIEQLRAFHAKWTQYYNRILEKYPLDNDLAAASKFNNNMNKILNRAAEKENLDIIHSSEKERLKANSESFETQIGYIKVKTEDSDRAEDDIMKEMLPDYDESSAINTGNFDPIEKINKYFSGTDQHKPTKKEREEDIILDMPLRETLSTKLVKGKDFSDRSSSGFSFEEALNPTSDLADIMKDLGLLLDE